MIDYEMTFALSINILYSTIVPIVFFNIFLERKSQKKIYIVPIILFALCQIIILMYVPPTTIIICINMFFITVIALFLYEGNIYVKFAFAILFTTMGVLIEFLVGYVFLIIPLSLEIASAYGIAISKVLSVGMFFVFKHMRDKSNILAYSKKYSAIILIVPMISLILMYVVFAHNLQDTEKVDIRISLLLVGVLIFTNIVVLKVYQLLIREFEVKAKHAQYIQQFQMKKEHNEEIELMISDIRKSNHDIKSHFITLRGYLHEKNIDEAYNYLDNLLEDPINKNGISGTGNIAIDSIINSKLLKMKKNNIAFKPDINIPAMVPFHGADLSILVGNILDNAIEANEKDFNSDKFINLYITYENNYLVVSCVNSYDGTIAKNEFGILQTIKRDKEDHGFGIASIKNVCRKYNGHANFEHTTDTFTVKSVLFINT